MCREVLTHPGRQELNCNLAASCTEHKGGDNLCSLRPSNAAQALVSLKYSQEEACKLSLCKLNTILHLSNVPVWSRVLTHLFKTHLVRDLGQDGHVS